MADKKKVDVVSDKDEANKTVALDEGDLKLLQTYGVGPYTRAIKKLETSLTDEMKKIVDLIGAWAVGSAQRLRGGAAAARWRVRRPGRRPAPRALTPPPPAPFSPATHLLQASRRATRASRRRQCGTCARTRS